MWRNKQSQSAAPSASSGRVVDRSSAPKVPASSGSPTSTTALAASWLAPTMKVKGEICGDEDLLVDGKVEGSVSVGQHRLAVGRNGQVTGGLAAREIIIHGKVEGNFSVVSKSIEIMKDASVIGDLTTQRIVIEDGASFKGSIEIEKSDKQVDSQLDDSFLARTAAKSA
jgi:cytoskeletal protein CcmA (bactofilin family)